MQCFRVRARIDVEAFEGDGRGIGDRVQARLFLDNDPAHKVSFSLSHLDFMRVVPGTDREVEEMWDRAIAEMAQRLANELTYAGLQQFRNPIAVQSHLSSAQDRSRSGLRNPGVTLVAFEI